MKILPFKISKKTDQSYRMQVDYEKHFYDFLHQHPEVQITLIIESEGKIIVGDYVGEFEPGDIYVIGSNLPHVFLNDPGYYSRNNGKMAHSVTFFFDWKILGQAFRQLPEMKAIVEFFSSSDRGLLLRSGKHPDIEKMFRSLFLISGETNFFELLNLLNELAIATEFEFLTNAGFTKTFSEDDGKRLDAIYRFTMSEFHRKITLDEVAGLANFTVNSFCRYFKKRTRKSYVDFLTEVRISQACKLLQDNKLNISDISDKVGFNNLSNFNRKFKEKNGFSPSDYRKNHLSLLSNAG